MFGLVHAHPLQNQIEVIRILIGKIVVIHGSTQKLTAARRQRLQCQCLFAARQLNGGWRSAIDYTNDNGTCTTMFKIVLDCVGQRAGLPQTTEHALIISKAGKCNRCIYRTTQAAANKSGNGCSI